MIKSKKTIIIVRIILILLAILFLWIGLNDGEAQTVLNKSINICMECIGIG